MVGSSAETPPLATSPQHIPACDVSETEGSDSGISTHIEKSPNPEGLASGDRFCCYSKYIAAKARLVPKLGDPTSKAGAILRTLMENYSSDQVPV